MKPGFAERKMIFVLEIYDIVKKMRTAIKVNEKLASVANPGAAGSLTAADECIKEYSVVNHRDRI